MMGSVAKVDENSFRVSDVQVTVRLGRKPCVNEAASGSEVLFAQMWVNLRILARFV